MALPARRALLIAALVAFGLGRGLYDCDTMPILSEIAQPDLRSTGYGIFNFSACISGGAAGALAGYLKNAIGLGVAFQAAATLLLLSAAILIGIPLKAESTGGRALS